MNLRTIASLLAAPLLIAGLVVQSSELSFALTGIAIVLAVVGIGSTLYVEWRARQAAAAPALEMRPIRKVPMKDGDAKP